MLQYITDAPEACGRDIPTQVKAVLDGGCRWVQLRMKEASHDEILAMAREIKPLCDEKEAYLVINDHVDICKEANASGVHLGKTDMLPSKARIALGPLAIIGVTANTFEDVKAVGALDIDYVGIGPFAMTSTKKNLAPVLGLEGEEQICRRMESEGMLFPRVAVGGIQLDDIEPLMTAGANGVAVCGANSRSEDMAETTRAFVATLDDCLKKLEK